MTRFGQQLKDKITHNQRRFRMWLTPGMGVKRWLALFSLCTLLGAIGFMHFVWNASWAVMATRWILSLNRLVASVIPPSLIGLLAMAVALSGALFSIVMLNRSMLRGTGTAPETAVDILYQQRGLSRGAHVVAVGGGTGLSNLLTGLKEHTRNITAVVTVADDGGSSGRLREALDMVAPGDLTDCYAALSDTPELARLLLHRFQRGEGLEGHTFGNLMLATLSEERGGLGNAMQDIHQILRVRGAVYPATTKPPTLVAQLNDGRELRGESRFASQVGTARIERVKLEPPNLPALPAVVRAIKDADIIVLGPGSLFTSIIPALLVPEIAHAIRTSRAPLVYVASLMTEPGETTGFTLSDHVEAITQHLGRMPDKIIMNRAAISKEVLARYESQGAQLIVSQANDNLRGRLIYFPLIQKGTAHHSPKALASALIGLVEEFARES